ncbi:MAG: (4S)-4-hydroxy-5-phosphonooxypentane-2,3-dione isomerase [Ostreibacterium sp.]
MHVTLVEINVEPSKVEQFKTIFLPNHLGSIKEAGNLRFDVLQDAKIPTRFIIYEVYRDEASKLAHKKTPHYLQCVKDLKDIMTEDRKKTEYISLLLGD